MAIGQVVLKRRVATIEESKVALRRLSDDDLCRLQQLARIRVIGLYSVDWQDLLHEAITRLLEGSRRWPQDVPLIVFLRETMRSIASDHWRRQEKAVVVEESSFGVDKDTDTGYGVVTNAVDPLASPERWVSASETLARIEDVFRDDDDALRVMVGMASGKSPREIQEESNMNQTRYASTQRRIRRRLAREFPERGSKSGR